MLLKNPPETKHVRNSLEFIASIKFLKLPSENPTIEEKRTDTRRIQLKPKSNPDTQKGA